MVTTSAERTTAATDPDPIRAPYRRLPVGWPFAVLFVGMPLWWLLGVWTFLFFVLAVPMALHLLKQRAILMPRGFGLWLVYLLWVLIGVLVLQVDAPGTVGGSSMSRYLVFGYRFAWYLAASIAALYVVNTRRHLSTARVVRALALFFVMLTACGLLGLVAPGIEFRSPFGALLPGGLANEPFIASLVDVRTAQVHGFLGTAQARPSAPFASTNSWGFAMAISLPFLVASWWDGGRRWHFLILMTLPLGLFTIVSSLNRGSWLAIAAAGALVVLLALVRGNARVLAVAGLVVAVVGAVLLLTPLGDLLTARLAAGHSDAGRENLADLSFTSALEGSPVLGFGTTRDVAGNFTSIAGGASAACEGCAPPPAGTHGQIWQLVFFTGLVGAFMYVGFFVLQFLRNLGARTPAAIASLATILILLVTLPIYLTAGVPIYIGLIAVGLLAREEPGALPSLNAALRPLTRHAPVVVVCALAGAGAGLAYHLAEGPQISATQRVLVPASELTPVPGSRPGSLDAEAVLARSEAVVGAVAQGLGVPHEEARSGVTIGAQPTTRILTITYTAESSRQAQAGVDLAVSTYLTERAALLAEVDRAVSSRYALRQETLEEVFRAANPIATENGSGYLWRTLDDVSRQWADAADVLAALDDSEPAWVISGTNVARGDQAVVRVASGFGLGILVGVALAVARDRRLVRITDRFGHVRYAPETTVAKLSPADMAGASRLVEQYAPLAGFVPDRTSRRALQLAATLGNALDSSAPPTGSRLLGGSRTLIVVDARSLASSAEDLFALARSAGLEPVGLVVAEHAPRTSAPASEPREGSHARG